MAHSDTSSVSLGRHFAPIALCALLCIVRYQHLTLLGMFVVAEGTMKQGFARVHVHLPVRSFCQFEEVTLTLCFHCSFWTEHFPWVSLPPLLS